MALDFPSNPTNGQVYDNFIYDSTKGTWKSLSSGASPSILVNPTITDAVISATAPSSTTVPLTVNGAASQSANLQEWKNNSGTKISSISASGSISVRGLESYNAANNVKTVSIGDDISGQIEIGRVDGVSGSPYIDFHSGATAVDYDSRIQATGGTGSNGGGNISLYGRIFKPSQPAFNGQSISSTANGGVATHGDIWFNNGNHYNSSNGRFTAPVSGYYLVSAGVLINSGGSGFVVMETLINGTSRRGPATSVHGPSGSEHGASASSICYLNANDYITVNLYSSTGQSTFVQQNAWPSQRNFFSVYLLG